MVLSVRGNGLGVLSLISRYIQRKLLMPKLTYTLSGRYDVDVE